MKKINFLPQFTSVTALAVAAAFTFALPARLRAEDPKPEGSQRRFASSDEAIKTLRDAAEAGDTNEVHKIFGPEVHKLLTGDKVQDQNNFKGFSRAMTEACVPEPDGSDRVILDIGTNKWPFPIPLVKANGQWFFDTEAGKEEIINRHIGHDELSAIGVCRAYVEAQKKYFSKARDGGVQKYALKFKSSDGKEDGLYWKSTDEPSPLSELVAEAHAEGYGGHPKGGGPHPFHGYYFRILSAQGAAAPGGQMSYLANGNLTGGFALVAYPDAWDKSGVMTFIVNQDGKVYQRMLGEKTVKIASHMTRYDPDSNWTLVDEPGETDPEPGATR